MLEEGLSAKLHTADGTTLLMYAALHGDAEGVKTLLDYGADPNRSNEHGATALIWGASDISKVKLLVEAGADVNAQSRSGATPLGSAAGHLRGLESVRYLLDAGADDQVAVTGFIDGVGLNPLEIAAFEGHVEAVQLLVDHRIKVGGSPSELSNALYGAISQNHHEIVLNLLDRFKPGSLEGMDTESFISEALGHSNLELVERLMEAKAKPSSLTAAAYSDIELDVILPKLISHGSDLHRKNKRGYSALDFARMRGHDKMKQFLVQQNVSSGKPIKQKEIPNNRIRLTPANKHEVISNAVEKSLSLLMDSSDSFLKNKLSCTSCHHQDLPNLAAGIALSRGIPVPADSLNRIHKHQIKRWSPELSELYEANWVTPGTIKSTGYMLWGRSALGLPPNPITKAVSWYMAAKQLPEGYWPGHGPRMPLQDGSHMGTALAIRALQAYPIEGREIEFKERIARARQWLEQNPTPILTRRAFRLLGLVWGGSEVRLLQSEKDDFLELQQQDGGWAQLKNLESDAWATGLTLYALHVAGLDTKDPAYVRGMEFLLNTQFEDGSWFVLSRSNPSVPHFDSGFPFGWDQWISAGATAIASASLALGLDPVDQQVIEFTPVSHVLITPEPSEHIESFEFVGKRTVGFEEQIRPILEDACMDCHSGDEPDGNFQVSTREALQSGGWSGISSIIPGNAEESPFIRHVTDKVEDMEMPPLHRRKSYPALTRSQIEILTTWINEGAFWPEGVVLQ